MIRKSLLVTLLVLCFANVLVESKYHSEGLLRHRLKEKVTHLHFYLHDILSGKNASAVLVAQAKDNTRGNPATPFGSVYAIDDLLTEGPEPHSKVIGNAQGLYASTGTDELSLVLYVDFGFTTGKFKGSSISAFSRNPVATGDRELAIVGGRGKFRMARGFAQLKTQYLNTTNGDAIIEYKVTLLHY